MGTEKDPLGRPVATVMGTAALVRSDRGPQTRRYRSIAEFGGALFRFIVGSSLADDGRTVIVPTGGGTGGAWVREREDDRGSDLSDSDGGLTVGDGGWRVMPAATLTSNRTLTLSTTNAAAGDRILVTRLDVTVNTVAIVNGGPGAGTLATLPASLRSMAEAQFDGTNWVLRQSGLLL